MVGGTGTLLIARGLQYAKSSFNIKLTVHMIANYFLASLTNIYFKYLVLFQLHVSPLGDDPPLRGGSYLTEQDRVSKIGIIWRFIQSCELTASSMA